MDLYEYLDEMNSLMNEMEDNNAPDEEIDNIALTMYSVAIQMGWKIELEYL